jgi:pimeloyl-ACP methyl ester carboxylesterase
MTDLLVLPRPGQSYAPRPPIPAPTEAAFTSTFGALLPAVQYLQLDQGRAAYYRFPPASGSSSSPGTANSTSTSSSNASTGNAHVPKRILLLHGVQTPALGLFPLIKALRARYPRTEFATLDLWGHGLSEAPFAPYCGELFHALVDGVLGALGWKASAKEEEGGVGILGFSFGAVVAMGYLSSPLYEEWVKESVKGCVLVAPAGLLKKAWFKEEELALLSTACPAEDEGRAAKFVVSALEGGELVVPEDWRDVVAKGGVQAQAVKRWQLENHKGHEASVVGAFRDGGVIENEELFLRMRGTGVRTLVVLGSEDGLTDAEEIRGFGFEVKVVEGVGHGVPRERPEDVAEFIAEFWRG